MEHLQIRQTLSVVIQAKIAQVTFIDPKRSNTIRLALVTFVY
jgi:hypothetical protein